MDVSTTALLQLFTLAIVILRYKSISFCMTFTLEKEVDFNKPVQPLLNCSVTLFKDGSKKYLHDQ